MNTTSAKTLWRFFTLVFFNILEMDEGKTCDYWSTRTLGKGEEQIGFKVIKPVSLEEIYDAIGLFYGPEGYTVKIGKDNGFVTVELNGEIHFNVVISLSETHLQVTVDRVPGSELNPS
jgi:hypothetical protein